MNLRDLFGPTTHVNCKPVGLLTCIPVTSDTGGKYTLVRYECNFDGYAHDTWLYYDPPIEDVAEHYNVPVPGWAYTRPGVITRNGRDESNDLPTL